MVHDKLPRLPVGKVDRAKLRRGMFDRQGSKPPGELTAEQAVVVKAWRHALGHASFDFGVSFPDAGGTSLDAMSMLNQLERLTSVRLPYERIWLDQSSISQIAKSLEQARLEGYADSLVPIGPEGRQTESTDTTKSLVAPHLLEGDLVDYYGLAALLAPSHKTHGFYPIGMDGKHLPKTSLLELAAHGVTVLKGQHTAQPYRLIGYSFGALLAFEMARILLKQGDRVDRLILIEPSIDWSDRLIHARVAWYAIKTGQWRLLMSHIAGCVKPTRSVRDAHLSALARYRPSALHGVRSLLVLSEEAPDADRIAQRWRPLLGQDLSELTVAGDHHSMMKSQNVGRLAEQIQSWLDSP